MTVAAGLNDYAAGWRAGEVVRLYRGGAAKVCERRLDHPSMPNWHEVLQPVLVLSPEHCDDVSVIALSKHDLAVRCARTF
ncbi:MAG: hypothetical protein ACLPTZ_22310 [Beijerinckiaceae bacterium]